MSKDLKQVANYLKVLGSMGIFGAASKSGIFGDDGDFSKLDMKKFIDDFSKEYVYEEEVKPKLTYSDICTRVIDLRENILRVIVENKRRSSTISLLRNHYNALVDMVTVINEEKSIKKEQLNQINSIYNDVKQYL